MCIYQTKCLYCESLSDKSQFINTVPTSGGTLIIPSRATRLRNNFIFFFFCRKFAPVRAAGALTGFDGSDQPQLDLCPHPAHGPSPFKLSLGVFIFLLVLQKCCCPAQLQPCLSLTMHPGDLDPNLWMDFLTCLRPAASLHSYWWAWCWAAIPSPACCAWVPRDCTVAAEAPAFLLHWAWFLACREQLTLLYSNSKSSLANKTAAISVHHTWNNSCQQIQKFSTKIGNTKL